MSRRDRRQDIFLDDFDRHDFVKTLAETCQKTGWQVHAYCLMRNHFHLVIETPNPNLVAGMRWLLSAYTIRLNHRHKRFGHVFSGRYKAQLIDPSNTGYLRDACDYVHLNPVRAGLLKARDRLASYPWSSFSYHLCAPADRPAWIRSDRLLGEHGIERENARGRKQFERLMEARRLEEGDEEAAQPFRRGWYIGGEAFRKAMIAKMERKLKGQPVAQVRRESAEIKAERILAEELKVKGWTRRELVRRRKSDPEKLALGARLRQETTLTIKQIARLVALGSYGNANARLHQFMKTNGNKGHAGIRRRQSKHAKDPFIINPTDFRMMTSRTGCTTTLEENDSA